VKQQTAHREFAMMATELAPVQLLDGKTVKVSAAGRRVLRWLGKGWRTEPGAGSALMVNGQRICNVDTMTSLARCGLVVEGQRGCWSATPDGRRVTSDLGL